MIQLSRILAGRPHQPVVYFARIGSNVKIGTTTNLRTRMRSIYVPLENVLAVVPGGTVEESAFHKRFRASRVEDGLRRELFRIDREMREFLRLGPEFEAGMLKATVPPAAPLPVLRGTPSWVMQELQQLLAAPGGTTAAVAGGAIGISKTTAHKYLCQLRDQNSATMTGAGRAARWVLTMPPEEQDP